VQLKSIDLEDRLAGHVGPEPRSSEAAPVDAVEEVQLHALQEVQLDALQEVQLDAVEQMQRDDVDEMLLDGRDGTQSWDYAADAHDYGHTLWPD
jgi:hypothetical protein